MAAHTREEVHGGASEGGRGEGREGALAAGARGGRGERGDRGGEGGWGDRGESEGAGPGADGHQRKPDSHEGLGLEVGDLHEGEGDLQGQVAYSNQVVVVAPSDQDLAHPVHQGQEADL